VELTGWNGYPRFEAAVFEPSSQIEAAQFQHDLTGVVARGNGRAYSDCAVGTSACLLARRLDRFRGFDAASATLTVESGVLLADIIAELLPRGFFPPVVPGTQFVTIGGMIAADVHGKNHHGAGSFGTHVESLLLALPSGKVLACSAQSNPDLLDATIGGMGLTGTILQATFRLARVETGWIKQQTFVAPDLAAALAVLSAHDHVPYSAAWIDCLARGRALGRSLVYLGEHATREDLASLAPEASPFPPARRRRLAVPLNLPRFTLNRWSVAAFNEAYFRKGSAAAGKPFLNTVDGYFFPLDGIAHWNRIYGRHGFLQHQCVVPGEHAHATIGEILTRVAERGNASFLAVLKKLGSASRGLLSFPSPGFTLALDLAIDKGIFAFLAEIDRLVAAAGGRIYLAKDARQSREMFESGYLDLGRFRDIRHGIDAPGRVASRLSERLGI